MSIRYIHKLLFETLPQNRFHAAPFCKCMESSLKNQVLHHRIELGSQQEDSRIHAPHRRVQNRCGSERSADNGQWINPDFGSLDLRTHYDNIRQMVRKRPNVPYRKRNGSAKARLPKLRDALPYVKECYLSSQTVTARQNHRQSFQVVPDVQGNTSHGKVLCHAGVL